MRWRRFKEKSSGSWHISTTSIDAVQFIPKRNILFFGLGAFGNYHKKESTQEIWWRIDDGEKTEAIEVVMDPGLVDEDTLTQDLNFVETGHDPVKVLEG